MGKSFIHTYLWVFIIVSVCFYSCSVRVGDTIKGFVSTGVDDEPEVIQPVAIDKPNEHVNSRDKLIKIYTSYVGVREKTGKNDGPEVELFLSSVGLSKGYAWCAAYVHYCMTQAGIKNRITAWSPTAENKKNILYKNGEILKPLQRGDVFTLYYVRLKRIGHTGFYDGMLNEDMIITVEGNTNIKGSNEGDGVYKYFRPLKSIHSISNHINDN